MVALAGAALLVVAGAVFLDRGWVGGPGRGQILLIGFGVAMIVAGALGRRALDLYRGLAVVVFTSAVLLGLLELTAIVIARADLLPSPSRDLIQSYRTIPHYADQVDADALWRELERAESYRYRSYTGWRHRPFAGELVRIDSDGFRRTPGARCDGQSFTVYAFGGSTMWGWGAPDSGTIPAHLQSRLERLLQPRVCVKNLGEDGYVSTQSVVLLLRRLQRGERPDAVVLYDGVNDVIAAWRSGDAGVHAYAQEMASKLDYGPGPTLRWVQASRLYWLIGRLRSGLTGETSALTPLGRSAEGGAEGLGAAVADVYLANYGIVTALAADYGFEPFFFWQPALGIGAKSLAPGEQRIAAAIRPSLRSLTATTYREVASRADGYPRLWDLSDAFDGVTEQLWIDGWGHITPAGNAIVAQRMAEVLVDSLGTRPHLVATTVSSSS